MADPGNLRTAAIVSLSAVAAGLVGWKVWSHLQAQRRVKQVPMPPKHWLLGHIPILQAILSPGTCGSLIHTLLFAHAASGADKQLGSLYLPETCTRNQAQVSCKPYYFPFEPALNTEIPCTQH